MFQLHAISWSEKKCKGVEFSVRLKKEAFFEEELSEREAIGKTKELRESLKFLGMLSKTVISNFSAVEENDTLTYKTRSISNIFKNFFSNLAESLLAFPNPHETSN